MEPSAVQPGRFAAASKRLLGRLLTMAENRLELLALEAQEERAALLRAILLALGVAAFGLLAGITLSGAVVVLLWPVSPVAGLLALTALYGAVSVVLYRHLTRLQREWENLPATFDQLRKDRALVEKIIS